MAEFTARLVSKNSTTNLQLLQQHLIQINNTPYDVLLRLTVTCDEDADILAEDSARFITILVQTIQSYRWELLHFEGLGIAHIFLPLLYSLQNDAWPYLKHLHLEASGESPYHHQELTFPNAPLLQHLTLNCFMQVIFNEPVSSINLVKLVYLELNNYTTPTNLIQVLRKVPFLKQCILRMHGDQQFPAPKREAEMVSLPHLRDLALITASNLNILSWLMTPNLSRLQVEMTELLPLLPRTTNISSANQLAHFIESFCPLTLTHLKLACCPFTDKHLLFILSKAQALTNLCVWWGPIGTVLDDLAANGPLDQSVQRIHCPITTGDVRCFGGQIDPQLPLYVPHLTRLKLYVHPSNDPDQRVVLSRKRSFMCWHRRCAFASHLCQTHRPSCDSSHLLRDLVDKMVVEPIHRDDDRSEQAFSIDFGANSE
ncbi:hypothetical protein CPB83DRAFT_938397 [Crepidotus variabilis]|uniref:Uncharacterized protein n=1 Tax=Crepidotus variabilis TaxID=179855 RepID=A0A9P6EC49_9AGAR|nr:hypothetical protein CPB83DRAFT_938397 [Crepidotus variabilis]